MVGPCDHLTGCARARCECRLDDSCRVIPDNHPPLEGGLSSSGDCGARPVAPVGVSLHLVVSLKTLAHKRLPIVALEGLGARVGVALLHLLLLSHGHGLTPALEAGGHERLALATLLVSSLSVAHLHALLLRVGFLLVGRGGYRECSCYERHRHHHREYCSHAPLLVECASRGLFRSKPPSKA